LFKDTAFFRQPESMQRIKADPGKNKDGIGPYGANYAARAKPVEKQWF
jgi:hypothetical protein